MEFNYLSLPHGDLARKRPTAAAAAVCGRTGQKGKARRGGGERKGEVLISSCGKKLDHLRFDLEKCHSARKGTGVRDGERKMEAEKHQETQIHTEGEKNE